MPGKMSITGNIHPSLGQGHGKGQSEGEGVYVVLQQGPVPKTGKNRCFIKQKEGKIWAKIAL